MSKRSRLFLLLGISFLVLATGARYQVWQEGKHAQGRALKLLQEVESKERSQVSLWRPQEEEPDLVSKISENYKVMGIVSIPKLSLRLPILPEITDSLLKVSVCRYKGPEIKENGNIVISGHNYKSGAHFGNLDEAEIADEVVLTDMEGNEYFYEIYDIKVVRDDDISAVDKAKGDRSLALFTCTDNGRKRLIVYCSEKTVK